MHKGVMSIPLVHKGSSRAADLFLGQCYFFMTCNVEYLLPVIRWKCSLCLHHCKTSSYCQQYVPVSKVQTSYVDIRRLYLCGILPNRFCGHSTFVYCKPWTFNRLNVR